MSDIAARLRREADCSRPPGRIWWNGQHEALLREAASMLDQRAKALEAADELARADAMPTKTLYEYRKKPVTVSAVRNEGEWKPIIDWLDHLAGGEFRVPFGSRPALTRDDDGTLNIETLEGTMRAEVGDWVICGVNGELYPCKPDIFDATYEAIYA